MLIAKAITAKITQIVLEHTHTFSCQAIFTSTIFSAYSATNLSTIVFLHLQFSKSKFHQHHMICHIHTHNH